jgi:putative NADPH-quinone reductase
MRLLIVHAHPSPESFNAALFRVAAEAARAAGHEVRVTDLHAEGFNPVMGPDEWQGQADENATPPDVVPHIENLRWAEGLILVYPTWWSAQPALLKGWMDRVWRPGIAFFIPAAGSPMQPGLTNIRLVGVITTLGSPWWLWTFLIGAAGRKIALRGLRVCTAPRTTTFWLALHNMESQTDQTRRRYLDRVKARIARIPL